MALLFRKKFDLRKQERKIIFVFILAVLFYSAFVLFGDVRGFIKITQKFNWNLVFILLLLSFSNYFFRFLRWQYFLRKVGIHIPALKSFAYFLAGLSMTITPGKTGEVVKAYLINKDQGKKYSEVIPLIFTERFTDGIGMIILSLGGVYLFGNGLISTLYIFLILFITAFIIFGRKTIIRISTFLDKRFRNFRMLDFILVSIKNMETLFSTKTFLVAVLISVISWGLEGISLYILFTAFGNPASVSNILYSLFIFSFASIAGFLVLIPGGIGVSEASITSLSQVFFDLTLTQSIFITLLFRFTTLWFGVLLGLICLLSSLSKENGKD